MTIIDSNKEDNQFKVICEGYQIVEKKLIKWLKISETIWWTNEYEVSENVKKEYHWFELSPEELPSKWFVDNIHWLGLNYYNGDYFWLIDKYLKDEDRILVYFIKYSI